MNKRRLPEWYSEKVNLAANVYQGAPQGVSTRMPVVTPELGGQGVSAQRKGYVATQHSRATAPLLDLDLDAATPSRSRE